jgi:hypothetical protein
MTQWHEQADQGGAWLFPLHGGVTSDRISSRMT